MNRQDHFSPTISAEECAANSNAARFIRAGVDGGCSARTDIYRQMFLQLQDALTTLAGEGQEDAMGTTRDHIGDETLNEMEQNKLYMFDKRMRSLDLTLQSFANAVHLLGSSVGVINASSSISDQLTRIRDYFRLNMASLRGRPHSSREGSTPVIVNTQTGKRGKARLKSQPLKFEELPDELETLADALAILLERIKDISEFREEAFHAVNTSLTEFADDLKYCASGLKEYKGQLTHKAVAQYINDLTEDIGAHLVTTKAALDNFILMGVPAIRFSQKHTAAGLQNLSTVATFFSGVTATTLQFSYNVHGNPLQDVVNALWLGSLVFSITSAINSQLSYYWYGAAYRSPGCYVPWWVTIWIKRTPLYFLVVSVIAFLAGLGVFTYSSQQSSAVSAVVTSVTSIASFVLICICIWFFCERWVFVQTTGSQWLLDILQGKVKKARKLHKHAARRIKAFKTAISRILHDLVPRTTSFLAAMVARFSTQAPNDEESQVVAGPSLTICKLADGGTPEGPGCLSVAKSISSSGCGPSVALADPLANIVQAMSKDNQRLLKALLTRGSKVPNETKRDPVEMLRQLEPNQELSEHVAPTRHLQFSPTGSFLATFSSDKTAWIWRVESGQLTPIHKLRHESKDKSGQVAWSPSGGRLLTKQPKSIHVWDPSSGKRHAIIDRGRDVQSVTWVSQDAEIMSVEWNKQDAQSQGENLDRPGTQIAGSYLVIMNINSPKSRLQVQPVEEHYLERLKVWSVSVIPEGRVVAIATLLSSKNGLQPTKMRNEKRIFVYNYLTRETESQVPFSQEARNISLTKERNRVLVSFKGVTPPQGWRIEGLSGGKECKLIPEHTYAIKESVEFSGASQFGGANDEFVVAASKGGDIHIWDRQSEALLRKLKVPDREVTNVAWNHGSPDGCMLACATDGRIVTVWTTADVLPPDHESSSEPEKSKAQASSSVNQEPDQDIFRSVAKEL